MDKIEAIARAQVSLYIEVFIVQVVSERMRCRIESENYRVQPKLHKYIHRTLYFNLDNHTLQCHK